MGGLPAEALTYTYDGLQRPMTMTGSTPYVTNTVYSGKSLVQQLELSTGSGKKVWQTYNYEKGTDRLTRSVTDVYGATAPAKDARYSYDQAGNVLSIADTANSAVPDVQCFAYDARQRLQDAWTPTATAAGAAGSGTRGSTVPVEGGGPTACDSAAGTSALGGPAPYWKSYETDAIGNRVSETVHDTGLDTAKNITRGYEYGGAGVKGDGPHQVTKVTEKTPTGDRQSAYEYDDAGTPPGARSEATPRTCSGTTRQAQRGHRGERLEDDVPLRRLRQPARPQGPHRNDGLPARHRAETVGRRHQDGGDPVLRLRRAGRRRPHHGQGLLHRLRPPRHRRAGDRLRDRRGQSAPLRSLRSRAGREDRRLAGGEGLRRRHRRRLHRADPSRAREYDAAIGKFISVDPVIDYTQPQQINGYAYANNSPVTHADPSGMIIPECREGLIECRGGVPYFPKTETEKAQSDVDQASRNVTQAQGQQSAAKQRIKSAGKALVKIARDILGVDAALDCISTGDVGACGETLLNIAGSFAGGLAGKILAKYGAPWNWAKGIKLAKRVTGLVGDLIGGAKSLWKANKAVGKARAGLAKATDKLADARKKAAEALKKRKKTAEEPECHSFLSGTKVLLADGTTKPIEKVKPGDKVVTTARKSSKTTVREVAGTIVTEDDKHFSDLTVKVASGQKDTLVATVTHPFWWSPSRRGSRPVT